MFRRACSPRAIASWRGTGSTGYTHFKRPWGLSAAALIIAAAPMRHHAVHNLTISQSANLEPQAESDSEQPLINPFAPTVRGVRDDAEARRIRRIRRRVGEVRGVRQIENLHPELKRARGAERELAEHAHVEIGVAGSTQAVESSRPESPFGYRTECRRVEPWVARPDAAEDFHRVFHLIGHLITAIHIERRRGRLDREWRPRIRAEQPVHLPSAENCTSRAAVAEKRFAFTKWQLGDKRRLEVMRPILRQQRLV